MSQIRSRLPESPEWRLRRTQLPFVGFGWSPTLEWLWQRLLWRMGQRRGWHSQHTEHQVHEECPYCRWGGPPLYQIVIHADWSRASDEELQMLPEYAALGAISVMSEHFMDVEDALSRGRQEGRLWSRQRAPGLDPPHHYTDISRLEPEPYDPEYFYAPEGEWIGVARLHSEENNRQTATPC